MIYYQQISIVCVCLVTYQISKVIFKAMYLLYGNFFNQPKLEEQGTWAVVTGANEEIGITFSEILAAKGLNLILYGSSNEDLQELVQYLSSRYNVLAIHYQINFAGTKRLYKEIEEQLKNYPIGVLINAASVSLNYPEFFVDVPYKALEYRRSYNHSAYSKIIKVNILPVTNLCRIIIPGMVKRRRGIIINVSSGISTIPSPLLTVYSASKAYVNKFSSDLRHEYAKFGITILCLTPGLITFGKKPNLWISLVKPCPERYVWHALRNLGLRHETCGYFPHSFLFYILRLLNYVCPFYTRQLMLRLAMKIRAASLSYNQRRITAENWRFYITKLKRKL